MSEPAKLTEQKLQEMRLQVVECWNSCQPCEDRTNDEFLLELAMIDAAIQSFALRSQIEAMREWPPAYAQQFGPDGRSIVYRISSEFAALCPPDDTTD